MRNSELLHHRPRPARVLSWIWNAGSGLAVVAAVLGASARCAFGQQAPLPVAQGFAVERLYSSAPGGGWFVMDTLTMPAGLSGVIALSTGYAHAPLRIRSGSDSFTLVSHQASANIGVAIDYAPLRFYVDIANPLIVTGHDGVAAGTALSAPHLDVAKNPDTLSDVRLGLDGRLIGSDGSPFRLGVGAQLYVPSGERTDYVTDGTYRAMVRVLTAGDVGAFSYAAHLGAHFRADQAPVPGAPRGRELLFGVAAGGRIVLSETSSLSAIVGPEVFGVTAFSASFSGPATALEALVSARLERSSAERDRPSLRIKLGGGGAIHPDFGAPDWRLVTSLELSDSIFDVRARGSVEPRSTPE